MGEMRGVEDGEDEADCGAVSFWEAAHRFVCCRFEHPNNNNWGRDVE